jgi:Prokaryotic Cytochrome C oxidase subunit IV
MTDAARFRLIPRRALVSWLILVAVTLVSFALGVEHGTGAAIVFVVLALTGIKVRLIGLDFMELRHAPIVLRALFEVYCVALWAVLSTLYLL